MTGLGTKGKLGIVFALHEEAAGLARVLAESRSAVRMRNGDIACLIGQLEVYAVIGGVGQAGCRKAVNTLIDSGAGWIISSGFAAGLDPAAKVGDVVIADRIITTQPGQATYQSDPGLLAALPPRDTNREFSVYTCDMVSVDNVIGSPEEKKNIYLSTGAGALDMESYAAAAACCRRGVPFAAIRSISDTASDSIPEHIITLISIESTWRQLLYIASRPHIWQNVRQMRKNAGSAANNLADVLGFMLLRMI
ncbi:hypothetical protein LLG46_11195 [bacterium]|nr:hypothetical protein [bacterium]